MPHEKADPALLWDMLDAAKAIHSFVTGRTFHEYLNNRMLRAAGIPKDHLLRKRR